ALDPSINTIFMIGDCPGCGTGGFGSPGGGGGGGVGLPGSGVVLAFLASVVPLTPPNEQPPPQPTGQTPSPSLRFLTDADLQRANTAQGLITVSMSSTNTSAEFANNNSKLIGTKIESPAPVNLPQTYT